MSSRRLLDRFATSRRSHAMNAFLAAARAGVRDPGAIVDSVIATAGEKLGTARRWGDWPTYHRENDLIQAIASDEGAAVDLARAALEHEALSPEAKTVRKAERAEEGRRTWMAAQPATEKQIACLQKLGHAGPVASKAEASALIDRLVGARRGAPAA